MIGIDSLHLREYVVRPVLRYLEPEIPYSLAAENLLLGTAAQESKMGRWLDQLTPGPGPGYGIFQMEKNTYHDHWVNYLRFNPALNNKVGNMGIPAEIAYEVNELAGNLYLATAMCRIHYRRVDERLPHEDDIPGMGYYCKRYYNTHLGRGTIAEFVKNYMELVR